MNQVSHIINLFSDIYCVSDMEFAKIHGEPLRRLITASEKMDLPPDDTRLRLAEIETKLADQQTQNAQMLATLNNTLQLLEGMMQNQGGTLPTATRFRNKNKNRPEALPSPNFDGDCHKGRGFLNACQAYFHLRPDNFPDEQTKI
jgi:hypothetical protein